MFIDWKTQVIKMSILPTLYVNSKQPQTKLQQAICRHYQTDFKVYKETQKAENRQCKTEEQN